MEGGNNFDAAITPTTNSGATIVHGALPSFTRRCRPGVEETTKDNRRHYGLTILQQTSRIGKRVICFQHPVVECCRAKRRFAFLSTATR
jgi:hypothetical protein